MKKILVPTDFSENADNALNLVAQLAEKAEVQVTLLNVVNPEQFYTTNSEGEFLDASSDENYRKHLMEKAEEKLKKVAEAYPSLNPSLKVESGKVIEIINQYVQKEEIDSVVTGRHHTSIYEDMLFGSNAESIIRTIQCPVLNVRRRTENFKVERIAFATNLKDDLSNVVNQINDLQELFSAKINLVYINTPVDFYNTRRIMEMKEEFLQKYPIANHEFSIYDDFTIETGITHFAQDVKADIIALAAHHFNSLIDYTTTNRTSDIVMDETECPVLTFSI